MHHDAAIVLERVETSDFGHLSVRSLSARIGGQTILDQISLEVGQGEIVGLLGRDGSGKTTCFEALAGLSPASAGQVLLNGVEITGWPIDRRARLGLAYLSEDDSIFRVLTVEENILLPLEASVNDAAERGRRLEELLADFELTVVLRQLATTLSGGERRRCEVARAMALSPKILLLDEPFKGLDPTSVASVRGLIESLRRHQVGVLVSDYDLHDLLDLTDRVYLLHEGRLIFSGVPDQLLENPEARQVFLGARFSL